MQTSSPINVNSASAPVFMASDPSLTITQAQTLADCQQRYGGFTSVGAFLSDCAAPAGVAGLSNVVTTSRYFLVRTQAVSQHHWLSLNSLLVTQITKNNKLKIVTVWQSFE